jgi:uncharacterized protein YchJ
MSYPVVKKKLTEAELEQLGFEPSGWTDEGVFHVSFKKSKDELVLDVSSSIDFEGDKRIMREQVVTLELNNEWVYIDINDFNELKTLTQILFK